MIGAALLLTVMLAACAGGSGAFGDDLLAQPHVASEVLLMLSNFANLTNAEVQKALDDILTRFAGLEVQPIGQTGIYKLVLPAGTDLADVLKRLGQDVSVVISEPNYLAEAPEGGPRDLPTLGSDLMSVIGTQQPLADLGLAQAHAFSTGAGILVAVVDTGLDLDHPFLAGRIASGGFDFIGRDSVPEDERDFVDNDGDGAIDEQFGHGTFVASLVLAMAPNAMILPVRVLDAEGFGDASTVAAGIVWAADAGAHVINVSVDIPDASNVIRQAISYAKGLDVVVVAAAGNSGASRIIFPARFSDVIGVTVVDVNGIVPAFANTGSSVSLVAPGVDLVGALPPELNPAGTGRWSGTSFSTPIVAGTAALVRSFFPALGRSQVIQLLKNTAQPVDGINPGLAGALGAGLVQPATALSP